jgi:hypothetical protein
VRNYDLKHLGNTELLQDLAGVVTQDRETTAVLLAHIAEVDERKLFIPAGHSSMHVYCIRELGFGDAAAFNRIGAARTARRFPALFGLVADGTLHVTAVRQIGPHLHAGNFDELVEMTKGKTTREIKRWLIRRFGRVNGAAAELVPELQARAERVRQLVSERVPDATTRFDLLTPKRNGTVEPVAGLFDTAVTVQGEPAPPATSEPTPEVEEHIRLHITIEGSTYDKLRYAQELLGHAVPGNNVAAVLDRALDLLIVQHEKKRFGATSKPRSKPRLTASKRHIPAHVKREVRARDGDRCTFVGLAGNRCESTKLLEFDHIEPVARGGESTVDNIRQRCRTHNQYEAERAFGKRFMREKRRKARAMKSAESSEEPRGRNGSS